MKQLLQLLKMSGLLPIKQFVLSVLFIGTVTSQAQQILDFNSKVSISLNDGTSVILYAQTEGSGPSARGGKNYYYLPTQAMLSKNPQTQVPEFLFLKYVTDKGEEQKGVEGALLHFLMQLGYTQEQKTEMQSKLAALVPGAVVKGPVDLFPDPDRNGNTFGIISAVVEKGSSMTKTLVTSGKAPLLEGGKVAVAANLDKYGAQLLAATFKEDLAITDLSCNFHYKYYSRLNGLKATIVLDYLKMAQIIKEDVTMGRYREDGKDVAETQSWSEMHKVYDKLVEGKAIDIQIAEGIPDPGGTSKKLIEIIFQIFLNKFTTPADDKPEPPPPTQQEKESLPGKKNAHEYYLNVRRIEQSVQRKTEVINMNYDYMLEMPVAFSQNLKTWYNSVKDNKNCVSSVYLNDPFYKRFDIRFVLDLDVKDIFDREINYVTVNIRKKRNSGNDFTDRVTLDKKYITDFGITAATTYAGGEDKNPEMYQYMVQYSLRGGIVFPSQPVWEQGQMQAVTLFPPIVQRTVEFEADLEKLKAANISRVTLQVRYKKINEEYEENINISSVKNEPLVSKMLLMDRDARGYVYRLIYNHTTGVKLALPWKAMISDNYVLATIPDGLLDKASEDFKKAAETGKTTTTQPGKVISEKDKILGDFKEVMGVKN